MDEEIGDTCGAEIDYGAHGICICKRPKGYEEVFHTDGKAQWNDSSAQRWKKYWKKHPELKNESC